MDFMGKNKEIYRSKIYKQNIFFEGSVLFPGNNLIYVLTWRERKVLRFQNINGQIVQKDRLEWKNEGWGLTHNKTHMIISDGSNRLYVVDENLNVVRVIEVLDDKGNGRKNLN